MCVSAQAIAAFTQRQTEVIFLSPCGALQTRDHTVSVFFIFMCAIKI